MKPKPKAKKKPTDATMRNVRAVNKKFEKIDQHLKSITLDIIDVFSRLDYLENINRISSVGYIDKLQSMMRKNKCPAK